MEVRELRVLLAVVEAGSISGAARLLHASQSSVSATVHSLERQTGRSLFARSRAGVAATPAGQRLVEAGRTIVETHDRVLHELRDHAGPDEAVVRLGVPLEYAASALSATFQTLATTDPDVRVTLSPGSTTEQEQALRRGALDVALLRDRPHDAAFDSLLVLEEPMGVVLAAHLVPGEGAVPLDALTGLRWIGFVRREAPLWWDQIAGLLRTHGVQVEDETGLGGPLTAEVKLAAATDGRSFALVSPSWEHTPPEGLVRRPLVGDPLVRRTWVVWRADSTRRDVAALVRALERPVAPSAPGSGPPPGELTAGA